MRKCCPFCGSFLNEVLFDGANFVIKCRECQAKGPESVASKWAGSKWDERHYVSNKPPKGGDR